jgi:hypothetical protein
VPRIAVAALCYLIALFLFAALFLSQEGAPVALAQAQEDFFRFAGFAEVGVLGSFQLPKLLAVVFLLGGCGGELQTMRPQFLQFPGREGAGADGFIVDRVALLQELAELFFGALALCCKVLQQEPGLLRLLGAQPQEAFQWKAEACHGVLLYRQFRACL